MNYFLISDWHNLSPEVKADFCESSCGQPIEPLNCKFRPDSNFSAVSERIDSLIEDYMRGKAYRKEEVSEKAFKVII